LDVFLYSGDINRGADLNFIKFVSEEQKSKELTLVVSTPGGSPDAAYKIGRYLHLKYSKIKVFVPGLCKSAGTLLAIAADELIFSPYGELGPLDIQMMKTDNIASMDSGLNISEAFLALEKRSKETFHDLIAEIVASSGGAISFHTASHSASEILASLYGPIFGSIDPEEVGSRARAMRIGEDYGKRLDMKYQNLKHNALHGLSRTYSSHGFVIDKEEACEIFHRVRDANETEKALVEKCGMVCRHPAQTVCIQNLTDQYNEIDKSLNGNDGTNEKKTATKATRRKRSKLNGGHSSRAVRT